MDLLSSKKPENDKDESLEYLVMPKFDKNRQESPKTVVPPETKKLKIPGPPGSKKKILAVIAGLLIAAALAFAGYYAYSKWSPSSGGGKGTDQKTKINVDVPDTENLDPDFDGLSNAAEIKAGTAQDKPDTDSDGLADGDEVNIYGSDPRQIDTDSDKYDDGAEVAGGYSPIVNSAAAADPDERQKWVKNSLEFGLHEPTSTTLKTKNRGDELPGNKTTYINKQFGYSIDVPDIFDVSEEFEGVRIDLFPKGSQKNADGSVNAVISVKMSTADSTQELEAFINEFYAQAEKDTQGKYMVQKIVTLQEHPLKPIRVETNLDTATYFRKDDRTPFIEIEREFYDSLRSSYDEVVTSFKFR